MQGGPGQGGEGAGDKQGGSMFITQRAQVSGQKVQKAVKLPKIESAKGMEPVTQSSQSTELLLANKEMAEVQHKLDRKKEEFQERMAKCTEREEIHTHKMSKLKQEEMKFQLFLKENDNKRQRAVKRAQDEKNIRDAKEKELELLRIEMKDTEAKLVLSKANLDAGLVYQTYLEEVVKAAPEDFSEIADIIKRYQTLHATNEDLQKLVQTNMDDAESSRLTLYNLSKQLQNDALVKGSEIAELQERLENSKLQSLLEEGNKEQRQDKAKDAIRELGEAQMASFNLYNRCRATHLADSRPKHETNKVMVALAYIEERFRDLQLIVKEVKIREAAVDKQMAIPKTASVATLAAGKSAKASQGSKGMAGAPMNSSMTASQSGMGQTAAAQPPLQ